MGWAIVAVLGFALEIGLVIWLARSNTARWERDHRAARAAVRAREQAGLRVRAAALVAHPHLSHIPHVHLPPRVVDRLAHTREALHHSRLHLPHRTRHQPRSVAPVPAPSPGIAAPSAGVPAPSPGVAAPSPDVPAPPAGIVAPPAGVPAPAPAPDDASAADTASPEQATS